MSGFKEYWNEHGDVYAMEIAEDAWDYRQTEVDELTLQVAEMKSRLNDAYTDGQSAMYVARQSKVDELQAENKILNQAAATHLRNQNHFKGLYDALVEQLYPYALDLNEPIDGYPKEYVDGYNRARECAHYNLLEMMESDVEYIKAQCGMLGGGGGEA